MHSARCWSIGKLNDIVIDASGRIEAAVIGVDGFLGLGGKDVPIGFGKLSLAKKDNGENWLVVSATKEQLQAAPEVDCSANFTEGVADPAKAAKARPKRQLPRRKCTGSQHLIVTVTYPSISSHPIQTSTRPELGALAIR